MDGIFIYGTLCYDPLLRLVLDSNITFERQSARLSGFCVHWASGAGYPVIHEVEGGQSSGVLLSGITPAQRARLDFYEAGFGYELRRVSVQSGAETYSTQCYFPIDPPAPAAVWKLDDWVEQCWPVTRHSATEIMGYYGRFSHAEISQKMGMIMTRATSRARAAQGLVPTTLRSDTPRDQVSVSSQTQPYAGFFTVEENDLSFPRFDGSMSKTVERSGFIGGDAAFVLPYDPNTDLVMIIEQFRYGAFARHDPNPWVLEPIAGRIDAGETPEECARREAVEEAGITLLSLEHASDYYPSPGSVSEFFYTYVGLTNLSLDMAGIGGLVEENEDIRSHVLSYDHLMELVSSGEAGGGPLVLLALWLSVNRSRLRGLS